MRYLEDDPEPIAVYQRGSVLKESSQMDRWPLRPESALGGQGSVQVQHSQ